MDIRKGTIVGFRGSWGSGLGTLVLKDEKGVETGVACENGATVRALESAFGNVIGGSHNVESKGGHVGQEIYYYMDEFGLCLGGFVPADEATPELVEAYEANITL